MCALVTGVQTFALPILVDPPERRVAEWPEEAVRSVRATYWGMISEVDRQIARLVEGLKAAGAWDDTVIALTSDHGEMMGDHWTLGKFGYFDQAYHVPLIVRDPRHPRSEEHTSELQSLMRISYAVFCLKKKKIQHI